LLLLVWEAPLLPVSTKTEKPRKKEKQQGERVPAQ
jgi:hypothetical protein